MMIPLVLPDGEPLIVAGRTRSGRSVPVRPGSYPCHADPAPPILQGLRPPMSMPDIAGESDQRVPDAPLRSTSTTRSAIYPFIPPKP